MLFVKDRRRLLKVGFGIPFYFSRFYDSIFKSLLSGERFPMYVKNMKCFAFGALCVLTECLHFRKENSLKWTCSYT